MTDFNTYLKRVPSEHRDKPKFVETLRSLLGPVLELQALMERVPIDYDLDSAVGKQLDVVGEWVGRNKFVETLRSLLGPVLELQALMERVPIDYDLDSAVGKQLDVVGEWVGRNRYVSIPIEGVFFTFDDTFFTFDDTVITGFDRGVWCGEYDATSGMTKLDDDSYRFLLKLQILANVWDGTPEKFYSGVRSLFNGTLSVVIEDHQDMTISIGVVGKALSSAQRALFLQQIAPFKPAGVRINVFLLSQIEDHQDMTISIGVVGKALSSAQRALFLQQIAPFKPAGVRINVFLLSQINDVPLLAFDMNTPLLQGFDTSGWAEIIAN